MATYGEQLVLLSTCSSDLHRVRDLVASFASRVRPVWLDGDVAAGRALAEIERAIAQCSAAIVVVSRNYLASEDAREVLPRLSRTELWASGRATYVLVDDCEPENALLHELTLAHDPRHPLAELQGEEVKQAVDGIKLRTLRLADAAPWPGGEQWNGFVRESGADVFSTGRSEVTEARLHDEDEAALRRGGFDLRDRGDVADDPYATALAEMRTLLATSLSTEDAAARLNVNASRIRQRLTASPPTLYGLSSPSRGWRLPAFQFTDSGVVPGISEVIAALDPSLHPVAVRRFLCTAHSDLVAESLLPDRPMSPLEWLALGFAPGDVVALAVDL